VSRRVSDLELHLQLEDNPVDNQSDGEAATQPQLNEDSGEGDRQDAQDKDDVLEQRSQALQLALDRNLLNVSTAEKEKRPREEAKLRKMSQKRQRSKHGRSQVSDDDELWEEDDLQVGNDDDVPTQRSVPNTQSLNLNSDDDE
jgi:hypothetical protein